MIASGCRSGSKRCFPFALIAAYKTRKAASRHGGELAATDQDGHQGGGADEVASRGWKRRGARWTRAIWAPPGASPRRWSRRTARTLRATSPPRHRRIGRKRIRAGIEHLGQAVATSPQNIARSSRLYILLRQDGEAAATLRLAEQALPTVRSAVIPWAASMPASVTMPPRWLTSPRRCGWSRATSNIATTRRRPSISWDAPTMPRPRWKRSLPSPPATRAPTTFSRACASRRQRAITSRG